MIDSSQIRLVSRFRDEFINRIFDAERFAQLSLHGSQCAVSSLFGTPNRYIGATGFMIVRYRFRRGALNLLQFKFACGP